MCIRKTGRLDHKLGNRETHHILTVTGKASALVGAKVNGLFPFRDILKNTELQKTQILRLKQWTPGDKDHNGEEDRLLGSEVNSLCRCSTK